MKSFIVCFGCGVKNCVSTDIVLTILDLFLITNSPSEVCRYSCNSKPNWCKGVAVCYWLMYCHQKMINWQRWILPYCRCNYHCEAYYKNALWWERESLSTLVWCTVLFEHIMPLLRTLAKYRGKGCSKRMNETITSTIMKRGTSEDEAYYKNALWWERVSLWCGAQYYSIIICLATNAYKTRERKNVSHLGPDITSSDTHHHYSHLMLQCRVFDFKPPKDISEITCVAKRKGVWLTTTAIHHCYRSWSSK